MSEYSAQFISMICCNFLYADEYVTDLALAIKSRVRKLAGGTFLLRLTIPDSSGRCSTLETDGAGEIFCPEELMGLKVTELPLEVFCRARCDAGSLKTVVHKAILDTAGNNNMTPLFFREDAAEKETVSDASQKGIQPGKKEEERL